MKIYTIIVTFNGMRWISKTISSIINDSPVIVVDNNSEDGTVPFIKKHFPSVKIFEEPVNHGFGIANNIGISHALKNKADAVFLLNQDASVKENSFKILKDAAKNGNYGILSPLHLNGDGKEVDYNFLKIISPFNAGSLNSDLILDNYQKEVYGIDFINAAAWFIPKRVLLKVGGFDPLFFLYGEDDNYCQRVLYHGFKIGIVPKAVIFHDSENNNIQLGEMGSQKYFNQIKNGLLVKYANVNNNNFKKIKKYKLFILRKAIRSLVLFNFSRAKILIKIFELISEKNISNSVKANRKEGANYLNIE